MTDGLRLPSGDILPLRRTVHCGSIGSAKVEELTVPSDDTPHNHSDRLSGFPSAEPAPAAFPNPLRAAGDFFDHVHAHPTISQVQQDHG